jgi:hypothetical protein
MDLRVLVKLSLVGFLLGSFGHVFLIAEGAYARVTHAIQKATRNAPMLRSARQADGAPDGFVFLQGPIKRFYLQDPLFPALNASAAALYRRVEICRPGELPAAPSFLPDRPGPWFEESQLIWKKNRPAALFKSANFSGPFSLIGLNVSDRLLTSAIFHMQPHNPSREPPAGSLPDGFSYFERGTLFASATIPVRERIKQAKEGSLASSDTMRDIAFSFFGVVVINYGAPQLRFGPREMTNRQAFAAIQERCEPGDIRIRYLKFAPENVSIIAFKHNDMLEPGIIDGFQIGAVAPGRMTAEDTLASIVAPYEEKLAFPKFLTCVGSIAMLFLIVRGLTRRTLLIVFLTWATGMLRSLVWRSGVLQPIYWAGFGLVFVPFLIKNL